MVMFLDDDEKSREGIEQEIEGDEQGASSDYGKGPGGRGTGMREQGREENQRGLAVERGR